LGSITAVFCFITMARYFKTFSFNRWSIKIIYNNGLVRIVLERRKFRTFLRG